MIDGKPSAGEWLAGLIFIGLAVLVGHSLPHKSDMARFADNGGQPAVPVEAAKKAAAAAGGEKSGTAVKAVFTPPDDSKIPDNDFGKMVRLGQAIFHDTQANAKEFVGNDLQCSNCHIDRGRLANSAPLWAAYVAYPAYRSKNDHVNTFQERLQGCFRFSMNGKAPSFNDKVLVALESYAYFLAQGLPTGDTKVAGRGYPALAKPASFDFQKGEQIYQAKCALCHGADGEGQKAADGSTVFPPLWGARSFNWGAGMGSINNAAGFIKANMPLTQGNSLSDEDAWNVAAFLDSHERPQDPRFTGSAAETRKEYHDSKMSLYGTKVGDTVLGENSPPSGTVP
jgi:thiosulfate dehydrogenase